MKNGKSNREIVVPSHRTAAYATLYNIMRLKPGIGFHEYLEMRVFAAVAIYGNRQLPGCDLSLKQVFLL